jgi:hypothetical protein
MPPRLLRTSSCTQSSYATLTSINPPRFRLAGARMDGWKGTVEPHVSFPLLN